MEAGGMRAEKRVFLHSVSGMWRLDADGELTQLVNYRNSHVPMGSTAFMWDSKLHLVGGEEFSPDPNMPFSLHPDSLNNSKSVYALEPPLIMSRDLSIPFCRGPKPRPFVVPVQMGSQMDLYVLCGHPLFHRFRYRSEIHGPSFEKLTLHKNRTPPSWKTLASPPYPWKPVNTSLVFEMGGSIFLLGSSNCTKYELSFSLSESEPKWQTTSYFDHLPIPSNMIAVGGFDSSIRIGSVNSGVWAYKFYDSKPIAVQFLSEVSEHCCPTWQCEFGTETILSDLGNQEVLFISSSMEKKTPDWDDDEWVPQEKHKVPLVHYKFVKLQISEIGSSSLESLSHTRDSVGSSAGSVFDLLKEDLERLNMEQGGPFINAKVSSVIHREVEMPDAAEMVFNYAMLSAFVL